VRDANVRRAYFRLAVDWRVIYEARKSTDHCPSTCDAMWVQRHFHQRAERISVGDAGKPFSSDPPTALSAKLAEQPNDLWMPRESGE
jgi:hypothetical protein